MYNDNALALAIHSFSLFVFKMVPGTYMYRNHSEGGSVLNQLVETLLQCYMAIKKQQQREQHNTNKTPPDNIM